MDEYFCLKCQDETGCPYYVDIPGSHCEEGVKLIIYQHLHGGENQQWKWCDGRIVSKISYPLFSLAVKEIKDGSLVILHTNGRENNNETLCYDKWLYDKGVIKLKDDQDYCLSLCNENLVLKSINHNVGNKWIIMHHIEILLDDDYFSLRCTDSSGLVYCIDIPGSQCEEGIEVIGYQDIHGGDNQQWKWCDGRIVSKLSYPMFSLAVKEIKDGSPVILHTKDEGNSNETYCYDRWLIEKGVIKLEDDHNFKMSLIDDKIVLKRILDISDNDEDIWEIEVVESNVKPATSCHLAYKGVPKLTESWTLENTVCVRKSTSTTYFCIIGWGPAGYSGIQQVNETEKVVIFSMWNNGKNNVNVREFGEDVSVSKFGGEGTGMKAMKNVDWKCDEKITFRVRGEKHEDSTKCVWHCSCWYSREGHEWVFIATYERDGNDSPFDQHFYSFVEDWDRGCGCEGHSIERLAEFSDAKLIKGDGETVNFDKANFTKVCDGCDKFAMGKAFGAVQSGNCFILSTGGGSPECVRVQLEEKYEQCTNEETLLSL